MELKELTEATVALFGAKSPEELPSLLMQCAQDADHKKMEEFSNLVGDLKTDHIQKIFQYYSADREGLKQDYSPMSVCRLLSQLAGDGPSVDLCAGSGALTISRWADGQDGFVCIEMDESAFGVLCFNACLRNMRAKLLRADVLALETFEAFEAVPGERFATLRGIEPGKDTDMSMLHAAAGVSNPPFNIGWEIPPLAGFDPRFGLGVPPAGNANMAFVLTLAAMSDRFAIILPNGILTSAQKDEAAIRKNLVDANMLDAVVMLPGRMFESTDIPTCVLVLGKNRTTRNVEMVDARSLASEETREQRGQFGGNSHTGRIYRKTVNVLSDAVIGEICGMVWGRRSVPGTCKSVSPQDIHDGDDCLTPARYIGVELEEQHGRDIATIAADINKVIEKRNLIRLDINGTLANSLGIGELAKMQDAQNDITRQMNESMGFLGVKFSESNYIRETKSKNQMQFSNGSKELMSPVMRFALLDWKARLFELNQEENVFLAELRDELLPKLMSGEIEIPDMEDAS